MKWLMILLMVGCTPHSKVSEINLIWHDGKCLLVADGMTIEQAKELQQKWTFEDCKVHITDTE